MLPVAAGHGNDFGSHRHEPTVRVLTTTTAGGADTEHHLVRRTTLIAGTRQHAARQLEQRGVIVQPHAATAAQVLQRVAKQREGLRSHLKAQHMALHRAIPRRRWVVAVALAGEQLLQLAQGLATSELEPLLLGPSRCHARQLTHGGPAELAFR